MVFFLFYFCKKKTTFFFRFWIIGSSWWTNITKEKKYSYSKNKTISQLILFNNQKQNTILFEISKKKIILNKDRQFYNCFFYQFEDKLKKNFLFFVFSTSSLFLLYILLFTTFSTFKINLIFHEDTIKLLVFK